MITTAELSENSHQGFEGLKAIAFLASMEPKSNTASGIEVCLRREGTGSRCSGKERDVETGLDWFITRYLSSAQGRFSSPDSYNIIFEKEKGRTVAERKNFLFKYLSNPQVWNKYAYVLNNPLKLSDPDGRREFNANDVEVFKILQESFDLANEQGDTALADAIVGVTIELLAAIQAVPEGERDPANLAATEWSIGQIGNTAWGRSGSVDNGITAALGDGQNKCSTFVANAYGIGAGVGFGDGGFPIGGLSIKTFFTRYNVLSANTLGSDQVIPRLPIVTSPRLGDTVGFNKAPITGHSGIYVGGGAMVYAGPYGGKIQTVNYNILQMKPADAQYRRFKP